MTYTLVAAICSLIVGECTSPMASPFEYSSHYDCLHAGYLHSITTIQNIGSESVNLDKIYIQFQCNEQHNL